MKQYSPDYIKCSYAAGAVTLVCLGLAGAQSIPPDEIHSRTVPYTPPSTVTLRTEVRVVEVPVVVRDGFLHAVAGLTRDNFEIYDDGKKQAITAFSVQGFTPRSDGDQAGNAGPATEASASKSLPPPRFLALCFDDLHLLPAILQPVKDAAERFVRTGLAPGDRVVVLRTSRSEKAQFTSDVPALVAQIAKVTSAPQAVFNDSERCVHILPHEAYLIANHLDAGNRLLQQKMDECSACYHSACPEGMITAAADVIWGHARKSTVSTLGVIDSLVDGMAKLPGQRIIVLTSGGFLTGTMEADIDRLMDKARHAGVLINGLDARGLYLNASAGMAYDGMGILASGTGGTLFHNNNSMEHGYRALAMAPETMYVLGFSSSSAPDARFHKLKVQLVPKRGYSLEARQGYMATPGTASAAEAPTSKLDSELMSSDTLADLPVSFTWEQWPSRPGVTVVAHLNIGSFHFKPWKDRRTQRLTILAVLLDSGGGFVAGKRSELELDFTEKTFAQFVKTGFTAAMTIAAPAGNYTVRAAAQDGLEGKLAAAGGVAQVK